MAIFSFTNSNAQKSIYDIAINDIAGNPINLNEFRGNMFYLLMWLRNVGLPHNILV